MKNLILLAGTLSVGPFAAAAFAQSTWNGTTDSNWATATNWAPGLPASGDAVIIADTTGGSNALNLDTSRSVGQITYGNTGTRISAFTLATGAANTLTINGGITATGAWTGGATAAAFRGNYLVPTAQTWTVGGSAAHATDQGIQIRETTSASVKGLLTLNADLTKEGTGQLMLTGIDVAGAGNLIINNGDLKLNAGSTLLLGVGGTGNITMNNASTLAVYKNSGTMSITRDLVMNGTSSLVTVNAGVVIASKTAWNGTNTLNAGNTADLTGAWTGTGTINRSGGGALNLTGNLTGFTGTYNATAGTTTLGGNFGGTVNSSGTHTLAGESTIAGNLTLGGGTLSVNPNTATALGTSGNLTLTGTTAIAPSVAPSSTSPFTILTYSGTLTGGATNLTVSGAYRTPTFDTSAPGVITMAVGSETRTWTGTAGTAWDANVSANWAEGDQKFFQADAVRFGNTGAGTVAITGVLNPKSITVDSTSDYNFTAAANNYIAGAASLTKSGTGTLTLAGVNTFNGGVTVTGGTLKAANNQALGANGQTITVAAGATLDLNGNNTANRDYAVTISGTGVGGAGALTNSVSGANTSGFSKITLAADASIGGTGRFDLRPITAGTGVLDLAGFTLTKTGANAVSLVDSSITAAGSINVTQGQLGLTRSTVSGAGSINFASGTTLLLENNSSGTVTKSISADGSTIRNQGAVFTVGSNLTLANAVTTDTLTDLTFTGSVTGSGSLTKTGAGKLVLTGSASAYTGSVAISAGTLLVNGAAGFSAVSIAAGATLGGAGGNITGAVDTAAATSVISPGASAGTLTVGSLNVADGARFIFELGTAQDLLNVTGALTAGGALTFDFSDSGGLLGGTPYTLLNYASQTGLSYGSLATGTLPAGVTLDSSFGTGGWLFDGTRLQVQFVPEPSASLLALAGAFLLGRRRTRRVNSAA